MSPAPPVNQRPGVNPAAANLATQRSASPAWRRVGLATRLVELLAEAALERGIHSFGASYLAQNRPVAAMLAHAGAGARHLIAHGVAELAVALDRETLEEHTTSG